MIRSHMVYITFDLRCFIWMIKNQNKALDITYQPRIDHVRSCWSVLSMAVFEMGYPVNNSNNNNNQTF